MFYAEAFGLLLDKTMRPLNMFRLNYGKNSRSKIKGWEKIEWALPLNIYIYISYLNFCISLLWFFYCHFSKQVSRETIERDSNMQHLIYFPREFYPWMVLFDWSGLFIKFYIWKYLGNYVNSLYESVYFMNCKFHNTQWLNWKFSKVIQNVQSL